ncbi:hypothetical protein D9M70_601160 [compost metagenome]
MLGGLRRFDLPLDFLDGSAIGAVLDAVKLRSCGDLLPLGKVHRFEEASDAGANIDLLDGGHLAGQVDAFAQIHDCCRRHDNGRSLLGKSRLRRQTNCDQKR